MLSFAMSQERGRPVCKFLELFLRLPLMWYVTVNDQVDALLTSWLPSPQYPNNIIDDLNQDVDFHGFEKENRGRIYPE